ncbi:MAG: DNA alkylation repair protein [Tissierellia bacterium]|nr:DNA alkylation repair protein [Tissierellia bacterium]
MNITSELFKLKDANYKNFQSQLVPNIEKNTIIGVRVPELRKFAKSIEDPKIFLADLPHKYYDENILHGILISEVKDYGYSIELLDKFLPFVDNWAVCDIISPKTFKKNKPALFEKIQEWVSSKETYTCRFGIGMLMKHFLDEDFKEEYLDIPASIKSDEYYINMMIAWFFATALAKQWEATIPYIENKKLSPWVHNKTIQKARESFRIAKERKEYLLKR